MIKKRYIFIKKRRLVGLEVKLGRANLVLVIAPRGYAACGYLNLDISQKLKDTAFIVSPVRTVKDLLGGKVKALSPLAQRLGIEVGMPAKTALEKLL